MVIRTPKGGTPRWVGLVGVAVAPWVLAYLVTITEWMTLQRSDGAGQTIRGLVSTTQVLVLLFIFLACLGADVFLRKGLTLASPHQHWTAGAWFALASVLAGAGFALVWGGLDGMSYMVVWSMLSGYPLLSWLVGAYFWKRTIRPGPMNALWDPPERPVAKT